MIVDSSAIVAILLREAEADACIELMANSSVLRMSAGTFIEMGAVLTRKFKGEFDQTFDRLMAQAGIEIIPVTIDQAMIGHAAYRAFGIGSGHEARLNFGDCFAYALAIETGEPLLFKGDDFAHTDVRRALS